MTLTIVNADTGQVFDYTPAPRRMTAVTVVISEPANSPEIDWAQYVAATMRLNLNTYDEMDGVTVLTSWEASK